MKVYIVVFVYTAMINALAFLCRNKVYGGGEKSTAYLKTIFMFFRIGSPRISDYFDSVSFRRTVKSFNELRLNGTLQMRIPLQVTRD